MLRKVVAVVVGYGAMVVWVMLSLTLAWWLLGPEGAFRPESWEPSWAWMAINLPLSLVGAMCGGYLAAVVGRDLRSVQILAGVILVLGFLLAFLQAGAEPTPEVSALRQKAPGELTFQEAGKAVQAPGWYNLVIPLIGAAGVMVGGRARLTRP